MYARFPVLSPRHLTRGDTLSIVAAGDTGGCRVERRREPTTGPRSCAGAPARAVHSRMKVVRSLFFGSMPRTIADLAGLPPL